MRCVSKLAEVQCMLMVISCKYLMGSCRIGDDHENFVNADSPS